MVQAARHPGPDVGQAAHGQADAVDLIARRSGAERGHVDARPEALVLLGVEWVERAPADQGDPDRAHARSSVPRPARPALASRLAERAVSA